MRQQPPGGLQSILPEPPDRWRRTTRVAVARVVREGEVPPVEAERAKGSIELVLDGARVVLAAGFDAQLLRDVVRALSERA